MITMDQNLKDILTLARLVDLNESSIFDSLCETHNEALAQEIRDLVNKVSMTEYDDALGPEPLVSGDLPYIDGAQYGRDEYGSLIVIRGSKRVVAGVSYDESGMLPRIGLGYDVTAYTLMEDGGEFWQDMHTSHYETHAEVVAAIAREFVPATKEV